MQTWEKEVRKRGFTPSHHTGSGRHHPGKFVARVLGITVEDDIIETRTIRRITIAPDQESLIYDSTQTLIPSSLPDNESYLTDRTRKYDSRRETNQDTARRFGTDEQVGLVTNATVHYNENGKPIRVDMHTIPESRLQQNKPGATS